jgi:hypothetical protein
LVTVLSTIIVAVPLLSVAVGGSKFQIAPSCTTLLVLLVQFITGGVVSITVTFWLQVALLLQPSIAAQVRVASKVLPQWPTVLVTVLSTIIVAVPLLSVAVGKSKFQAAPSWTILLVLLAQFITGAVVSITATVWLHVALLLQPSIAAQVRVASKVLPQWPAVFVTVLNTMIVAVPLLSVAVGGSKFQGVPSCTILFVLWLQFINGTVVSTTITVWLHCEVFPQESAAAQVRVASKVLPQWPAVLVTVLTTVMG